MDIKKITAAVLAGALALSLTACGNKELKMNSYSIAEEAEYYHNLTGKDVSVNVSVAMHPSLLNSAVTMPKVESVISDSWYNDADDEDVTLSVYKSISENEAYSADTFLLVTLSGSTENLSKGINTDTLGTYLGRYFKSRAKKEINNFVNEKINASSGSQSASDTVEYEIGGMGISFTPNENSVWTLQISAYYDSDVVDDDGFIDSEKIAKAEPYISGDFAKEFVGDASLVVDFNSVYDLFALREKMAVIEYETVNAIYQSDRSVTAEAYDSGERVVYRTSVVYKPTNDDGVRVKIKQGYAVDEKNKTVTYTLSEPGEDITDEELIKIISALTEIAESDTKKMLESKGTEIEIDGKTKAVIDSDRALTVSISLE